MIYVNGNYCATKYREDEESSTKISFANEENVLDILVENMGRVNYGPDTAQKKGITDCVMLGCQKHFGWEIYPLPLNHTGKIPYNNEFSDREPSFYRGVFEIQELADTYFDSEGWQKGCVFVNGFNIGRYWQAGPQKTLYIPAPLLQKGQNEIVIFELYGGDHQTVHLTGIRSLG